MRGRLTEAESRSPRPMTEVTEHGDFWLLHPLAKEQPQIIRGDTSTVQLWSADVYKLCCYVSSAPLPGQKLRSCHDTFRRWIAACLSSSSFLSWYWVSSAAQCFATAISLSSRAKTCSSQSTGPFLQLKYALSNDLCAPSHSQVSLFLRAFGGQIVQQLAAPHVFPTHSEELRQVNRVLSLDFVLAPQTSPQAGCPGEIVSLAQCIGHSIDNLSWDCSWWALALRRHLMRLLSRHICAFSNQELWFFYWENFSKPEFPQSE